ncbi:quinolinate synthase [candidate division WOR-1 bacterium RIFCSPLOWO2_02_FULL_46_20]|uniref:Quinolinate synthase n=1 Tax=candidate division WOR-1 bacterium RIFCSPLOWO2_02_FULL_46_20 TaxID=1802567 RepID=A0A1F4R8T5_UNCSA|nr:MAG: quinolinate synthase [candidate division WOR-1 bacterium RIFCSPHIGHO2_02_FULL_45_12]OGC04591.1 MAG: quinolinate synthase [candidate division WOR-1 bacterium RIFCSPLOWO2_02_FULL_46_20]
MAESLVAKIQKLKKERNAVILAHNYQLPEVQDIADYTGDSLGLSIEASKTRAEVIVFCGVNFMAETAAIISPGKKVIVPEINAGCPMADMINVEKLKELKNKHPKAKVVCYVNSGADIKAESDICCTSANAAEMVDSLKDAKEIIFVPDKFLGHYISTRVKDKKFILWQGFCPTHAKILPEHIKAAKEEHPDAEVLVHPECRPETIALADQALSTGGMLKYVKKSGGKEFIVGTEVGMLYPLQKESPVKRFYPALEQAICPNMKMTNMEKVLWSLEDMKTEVQVPKEIADRARLAIDRMLSVSGR